MLEKEQAQEWLRLESLDYQEVEGEEGVQWHLTTEFPSGGAPTSDIAVPLTQDHLLIGRGTNVAERHRSALLELEPEAFQEFKFGLLTDLLRMDVNYTFLTEGGNQNITGFQIQKLLRKPPERHEFINCLQKVHNASMLAIIHIRRATGDQI